MKISLNTLKYYVDINVPVEELCDNGYGRLRG